MFKKDKRINKFEETEITGRNEREREEVERPVVGTWKNKTNECFKRAERINERSEKMGGCIWRIKYRRKEKNIQIEIHVDITGRKV